MNDITKRANKLIEKIKSLDIDKSPRAVRGDIENVLGLFENTLVDHFDYRVNERDCEIAESAIKVYHYLIKQQKTICELLEDNI